jgi:hypothetical protein
VSDVDGAAIDDDEDYYIPVELVTITSQIGPNGIREISRRTIPTARTSQAALEVAHLEDDFE